MAKRSSPNRNEIKKLDPQVKVAIITGIVTVVTAILTAIIGPIILKAFDQTPTSDIGLKTPSVVSSPLTILPSTSPSDTSISASTTAMSENTVAQSPTQVPVVVTSVSSGTPIKADQGIGQLLFKTIQGCDLDFYIYDSSGNSISYKNTAIKTVMGVGVYNLGITSFCQEGSCEFLHIQGVNIQDGQDTVIDLTQQIGGLWPPGHQATNLIPDLLPPSWFSYEAIVERRTLHYYGYPGSRNEDTKAYPNRPFCFSPGKVSLVFSDIPSKEKVAFDVEIQAGKIIETPQEFWEQIGFLSFTIKNSQVEFPEQLRFIILGVSQNNDLGYTYFSNKPFWMKAGVYTIQIKALPPWSNFDGPSFSKVEIKGGKETVLSLPIGRLDFIPPSDNITFTVYDQTNGNKVTWGKEYSWLPTGTYKVVMGDPIPGYTFNNVTIDIGQATTLTLP